MVIIIINKKFDIFGMSCSSCSSHIEKKVSEIDGVKNVSVNLLSNNMMVKFDENIVNEETIISTVKNAGYDATYNSLEKTKSSSRENSNTVLDETKQLKTRVIISFIFLIPLFYISMGHMMGLPVPHFFHGYSNSITFAFTQLLLCLPIVYVNMKYFTNGFKSLFKGSPNMDSLVALGSGAALIYGVFAIYNIGYGLGHNNENIVNQYSMDLYFESAAMILTLITLGKFLETRSKGKTSEAITKLMDLAPKTAIVERDGKELEVSIDDLVVNDIVIIKPGNSIPVDGEIIYGTSSVDESAITGESIPIEKTVGDKVISATINKSGYVKVKALKVGSNTTLAQIIELVQGASATKAPIAKLADKISSVFVPIVISISVLSTIIWLMLGYSFPFALTIGIAVLVISCPCALGLATPTAIMVGTGKGAENGVLIKSAESLEIAHSIKTVVMDKTGTITEGKPRITDIIPVSPVSEEQLLTLAASIEKHSEHPLAEAITLEAKNRGIKLFEVQNFKYIVGQGIEANVKGKSLLAGNIKFMNSRNIELNGFDKKCESLAEDGKTPLYFADNKKVIGVIAVADIIKSTSKSAIQNFKSLGIEVVMLTGDNSKTAKAVQRELEIDKVIAEVLPQDKENEVRKIQQEGKKVAMIGDGINDAPALMASDVGIAIGAGTDIAIDSADIVLMKSNLQDAVFAVKLSKAVMRNIKQNLFWAFFYNTLGIPLAAGVFYFVLGWKLNPMFAAAAMSLSSICVVLNALRLKLFKA